MEKSEKKLDRRVVKTRKAIRQAFHRKLSQQPLKNITVSALASEADIDRKTFYLHFDSMDDLVAIEVKELVDRLVGIVLPENGGSATELDLRNVLYGFRDLTDEDPQLYGVLLNSVTLEQIIGVLHPAVMEALARGKSYTEAQFAASSYVARFYLAGVLEVFLHWFNHDHDVPLEERAASVEQLVGLSVRFNPRPA